MYFAALSLYYLPQICIHIFPNIYTYTQGLYKIPGSGQAAAARPGPETPGPDRGPRLGTGPGCRRVVFCTYLVYICVYLTDFLFFW